MEQACHFKTDILRWIKYKAFLIDKEYRDLGIFRKSIYFSKVIYNILPFFCFNIELTLWGQEKQGLKLKVLFFYLKRSKLLLADPYLKL